MSVAPSGRQFEISRAEQRATVVELGGGVREYTVGDRDVLEPYSAAGDVRRCARRPADPLAEPAAKTAATASTARSTS